MKWIKNWDSLFEGYLDEPEYKEISREDYINICYYQNPIVTIDISKSIINKIKEKTTSDTEVLLSKLFPKRKEKSIFLTNDKIGWKVFIIELKDEWFIVVDSNDYIKCDGTTGLFKCLKDRNIIK